MRLTAFLAALAVTFASQPAEAATDAQIKQKIIQGVDRLLSGQLPMPLQCGSSGAELRTPQRL
jgi:hypothetical protein